MKLRAHRPALVLALALPLGCASPKSEQAPADAAAIAPANEDVAASPREPASAAAPAEEPEADNEAPADGTVDDGQPAKPDPKPGESGARPNLIAPDRDASGGLGIEVPMINGGLNRDIIRRIARDGAADIRGCHALASSGSTMLGKLIVEIELAEDGSVDEVKIAPDGTLSNRQLEDCVERIVEGWSFTEAGAKGSAQLAFEFLD